MSAFHNSWLCATALLQVAAGHLRLVSRGSTVADRARIAHPRRMNAHELGFASFLAEPGQRRMRELLQLGPKKRDKVRALLDHSVRLDPRFAQPLRIVDAEHVLQRLGAPDSCFLVSGDSRLDGREMRLGDALREIGHPYGGFISCIPAKLGFFAYEDGHDCYLLQR